MKGSRPRKFLGFNGTYNCIVEDCIVETDKGNTFIQSRYRDCILIGNFGPELFADIEDPQDFEDHLS